jgi:hypothetical protein
VKREQARKSMYTTESTAFSTIPTSLWLWTGARSESQEHVLRVYFGTVSYNVGMKLNEKRLW